jgi:thioredoxin-dependent peroxiredoxin
VAHRARSSSPARRGEHKPGAPNQVNFEREVVGIRVMLRVGEAAPDFCLPNAGMELVSLSQFKGKHNVVLFFYPKDGAPSCTQEAIEFSDLDEQFRRLHTVVFGVSCDDCIRHAQFRDTQGLSVDLLADEDGEVCKQFGVWKQAEKDNLGKPCVARSTFIIDKRGVVRCAVEVSNAKGHAQEVLRLVKEFS